jgi:sialidase-1
MSSIIRIDDPSGGERGLLLHSLPNSKSKRNNGSIFFSRDNGTTWQKGIQVENEGFAYSCLTALTNGNLGCLYERLSDRAIVFAELPLATILPK